jgi:hypothetical protein
MTTIWDAPGLPAVLPINQDEQYRGFPAPTPPGGEVIYQSAAGPRPTTQLSRIVDGGFRSVLNAENVAQSQRKYWYFEPAGLASLRAARPANGSWSRWSNTQLAAVGQLAK